MSEKIKAEDIYARMPVSKEEAQRLADACNRTPEGPLRLAEEILRGRTVFDREELRLIRSALIHYS